MTMPTPYTPVRPAERVTDVEAAFRAERLEVLRDFDLRQISRWRIGGKADYFVEPANEVEIKIALEVLRESEIPYVVIGDSTNLLFDDEGFRGAVIKIGRSISNIAVNGTQVRAGAGIWVPSLAKHLANRGLSGAEHIVGIPGTLGGLIAMNGGSMRRSIGENVSYIRCTDYNGQCFELSASECEFRYRSSRILTDRLIVLEVTLELELRDISAVRTAMINILSSRRNKFPKQLPNCGSVFVSDPSSYARNGSPGFQIEMAGLKGRRVGSAEISKQHANFIVNRGGARSSEVLELIRIARFEVLQNGGDELKCEVRYVTPSGCIMPAHEAVNV